MNNYTILDTIGQTQTCKVYEVLLGDVKYAVKTVTKDNLYSIFNECSIYSILDHPNIMKPHKYVVSSDLERLDIYMDLGKADLRSFIVYNKKFTQASTLNVMWQLLNAVNYMHNCSIIHRDLKTQNIVKVNDKWVIIDFDTGKYVPKDAIPNNLSYSVQTILYRSPEVILEKPYTSKIDIWSLGCILFEMITGKFLIPYGKNSKDDTLKQMILDETFIRGRIETEIKCLDIRELLFSMLNSDPSLRKNASELMEHPIFSGRSIIEGKLPSYRSRSTKVVDIPKSMKIWLAFNQVPTHILDTVSSLIGDINPLTNEELKFLINYFIIDFDENDFSIYEKVPKTAFKIFESLGFNIIMK